ncbi:MAG TPA: HlyD family efflux transporter periplasmic adaptor subunit [Nannocystaceae bacterium]|nr:HlyD family efflux transporter periplasmic adaptor subunit [Nannocystaceae bacterium]
MRSSLAALLVCASGCTDGARVLAPVVLAVSVDRGSAATQQRELHRWFALVVPRFTIDVGTPVAGHVVEIAVGLGARVQTGDTIAVLDNADLRHALRLAEGHARAARGRLTDAGHTRELSRRKARQATLLGDFISADDRQERGYELRRASAQASSARGEAAAQTAEVDRLRAQLQALDVRAPFAAEVAAIHRDPGQSLRADEPVVRLVSLEQVVRFAVDADEVAAVPLGAAVEFVADDGQTAAAGRVIALAPEVDAARMVIVEAAIASESAVLRAGTHGYVRVR